ncbi:enoyl-CoA hydratase/isomerase family protein [Mycobacteroides abscessus 21]|uniref:3-hydroxyisobutyryl-CoA hydrolase n=1 Tax=Mycobacteroides abscessus 21 TaxID=1299324 RepID=A0A829PY31_9MYCO|nr:enoyl-CoA hydratase/isomerase family protein [Mycobacteroides abscessus 21]
MTDQIETRVEKGVGLLTLNRPKAINSLTYDMIAAMSAVLAEWEADDAVRVVVLSGAGERGLCAGGDVVAVHDSAKIDGVAARRFFRDEYVLNAQIARFPKPYVALMDGIVMGGGVGVGGHANIRIVTDTSKVAMPEVGIGFIPDVGGTYLLSRAPASSACTLHSRVHPSPEPTPSRWASPTTTCRMTGSRSSPRPSSIAISPLRLRSTAPTHRRVICWLNAIGSTSATAVNPSPISSPRCRPVVTNGHARQPIKS